MDEELRRLERAYEQDPSALPALNRARRRNGLPVIRLKVVHYVTVDVHYRLGENGKLSRRFGDEAVWSLCRAAQVWPRTFYAKRDGVYYTSDREQVTCKSCDKILSKPDFKEPVAPKHLLVTIPDRDPYRFCGADTIWEATPHRHQVTCQSCRKLFTVQPLAAVKTTNTRQRRRLRRQAARSQLMFKIALNQ